MDSLWSGFEKRFGLPHPERPARFKLSLVPAEIIASL
jgi:hypothetical protein